LKLHDIKIQVWERLDLFKADIYSLGMTLYQVACCLNLEQFNKVNESESEMQTVYYNIQSLKYPLCVK